VWQEANSRNYKFDESKFESIQQIENIDVFKGQVNFEKNHLLNKLEQRDKNKYDEIAEIIDIKIHPLFNLIDG
jgi:hypothetical protein